MKIKKKHWTGAGRCTSRAPLDCHSLDKVMSCNQWHIGVHQRHLMFKGHWRAPHETIYGHKKKLCLDKIFPLGHFMLHFIIKWLQKLVMANYHILKKVRRFHRFDSHDTQISVISLTYLLLNLYRYVNCFMHTIMFKIHAARHKGWN